MIHGYGKATVKLTVVPNEPLARLAEQRLGQEGIRCMVRSLGVGPGGWGTAMELPHALYVKASDEMMARQVLDLSPQEIAEREDPPLPSRRSMPGFSLTVLLVVAAAVLIFGLVEVAAEGLFR